MYKLVVCLACVLLFGNVSAIDDAEFEQSWCFPSVPEAEITRARCENPFDPTDPDGGCLFNWQMIDAWNEQKFFASQTILFGSIYTFEGMNLSIRDDCDCWFDPSFETNWVDIMCVSDGKMLQERSKYQAIKPLCVEIIEIPEQQTRDEPVCRTCSDPIEIGEWVEVGCIDGYPVLTRELIGEKFNLENECVAVNDVKIKVDKTKRCGIVSYISTFYGGFYILIPIIVLISILLWKRKVIGKWLKRKIRK